MPQEIKINSFIKKQLHNNSHIDKQISYKKILHIDIYYSVMDR